MRARGRLDGMQSCTGAIRSPLRFWLHFDSRLNVQKLGDDVDVALSMFAHEHALFQMSREIV